MYASFVFWLKTTLLFVRLNELYIYPFPTRGEGYFFVLFSIEMFYTYMESEVRNLKFEGAEIEYFINYLDKSIHIIDTRNHGTSISNLIAPYWMKKFIEHEKLLEDVMYFDWYCYSAGGIIGKYNDYQFTLMDISKANLHNPYVVICRERRGRPFGN